MISVCFQGKPFNIIVIQVNAPTCNAEETEVEWFSENLQDLLELTPQQDVLFIIGDWNAKVGSQETPGVTGKFALLHSVLQGQICLLLQANLTSYFSIPGPYNEMGIFFGC